MSKIGISLVAALLLLLTPAWSTDISIASSSANPGTSILVPVTLADQDALVSAVQLDLEYDSSFMTLSFLLGEAGQSAQKRLYTSQLEAAKKRIILIGPNRNPLPKGSLFNISISLKSTVPPGTYLLKLSQAICSDPDGHSISVSVKDGSILVQTAAVEAAPIRNDGVLNAASLQSGSIAPGEIITLVGSSIGPASLVKPQDGILATSLGGTRVLINGVAAPLLYASPGQINAMVPYAVSGSSSRLVLEAQGQKLAELILPVVEAAPAIFTLDSSGWGQGAILNEDYSINSFLNPAQRGSVVSLFATGAGQTDPAGMDAQIADDVTFGKPLLPVSIQIDGTAAELLYAGPSPGLISNLLQVNFRIPNGILPAWGVPVSIQVGAMRSPEGVTIAVK
ncbi:MAG: cohesin domain-containing protein [Bryobacteraceae bacterium]